jgi:hypothetical protein
MWVRKVLSGIGFTQREVDGHFSPEKFSFEGQKGAFCFIRHPYEWYKSFWQFKQEQGDKWNFMELDKYAMVDLSDFIKLSTKYHPGYLTNLYKQYTEKCDYIGKCETLASDLVSILKRIGFGFNEGSVMKSRPVNTTNNTMVLDSELKKCIYESEKDLIDKYYKLEAVTNG